MCCAVKSAPTQNIKTAVFTNRFQSIGQSVGKHLNHDGVGFEKWNKPGRRYDPFKNWQIDDRSQSSGKIEKNLSENSPMLKYEWHMSTVI